MEMSQCKPCFKCGRLITINDCNAPNYASIWKTYGNWGCTVYDEIMPGAPYLEIYICDKCLVEGGVAVDQVEVVAREMGPQPYIYTKETWAAPPLRNDVIEYFRKGENKSE